VYRRTNQHIGVKKYDRLRIHQIKVVHKFVELSTLVLRFFNLIEINKIALGLSRVIHHKKHVLPSFTKPFKETFKGYPHVLNGAPACINVQIMEIMSNLKNCFR